MKGLELSERYFKECGLPQLKKEFGELLPRMAIGLVGDGSECFGFDDTISRDHDWGPGFCIWLDIDDLQTFGAAVQQLYDTLPTSFQGYDSRLTSQYGAGRVGVLGLDQFYQRFLGANVPPITLKQWLVIPENALATAVNGKVFHDPHGKFSGVRAALKNFYPEDVRLKKIAARCMAAGQSGQYNFSRCLKRNEMYAVKQSEMKFLESLLSLVFLLNKKYLPFYKWAHRAVKTLPILGNTVYESIDMLMLTEDYTIREEIIEKLSSEVIHLLREFELSDHQSDFLPDHGPVVQAKIESPDIRGLSVMMG